MELTSISKIKLKFFAELSFKKVQVTKKASGKGGHHLRVFWPSNASRFYTGETPERNPPHTIGARRLEGLLCLRKTPFQSGGNTYKPKNHEEIFRSKGFQKHAISATL